MLRSFAAPNYIPATHSAMKLQLATTLALGLAFAPAALAQPTGYPTYNGMIATMQATAANFPAICQAVNLTTKYGTPRSWQGKDIWAIKISDNVGQEENEPSFLMVGAHHGNEIGTVIVTMDAIAMLSEGYANSADIRAVVDANEIWIVPLVNVDGYPTSRHNRNPSRTVDLNRNYPFNWGSPCNTGTKGSGPGSEPETKTIVALSEDQRFAKVIDFHSSGRETLYAYRQSCPNHRLTSYLRAEAVAVSTASSYGGRVRGPSSDGEHYHHQLGEFSNYAFLTEISNTQSPSIASANAEAVRLRPGHMFMLNRPIPVSGNVTDAVTGAPIEVNISYVENPFTKGERNRSDPLHGRYHAWLPTGNHTLRFAHPCYVSQTIPVTVTAAGIQLDVAMARTCAGCSERNGSGINPTGFDCTSLPILGRSWDTVVPTAGNTISTHLGLSAGAAQTPLFGGEFLLGASPLFVGGNGSHSIAVPNSGSLLGAVLYAQGFRLDSVRAGASLTMFNGQTVTLGRNP